MILVRDVEQWLGRFAPLSLAESWDNVGLLLGDGESPVSRIMTCLTVTPETAGEAIDGRAELVVSHHPILFKPTQRVLANSQSSHGCVWSLARAGVAVYSPHTAYDNCVGGINDQLAERLGLGEVGPLEPPQSQERALKVVVFCPREDRARVLDAMFAAGAGHIGAYSECSYSSPGVGTFHGDETTNPAIGQRGQRERVREWRVEVVCPEGAVSAVLAAIRASHSYEEPAIDVYALESPRLGPGRGRLGSLAEPMPLADFGARVGYCLGSGGVQLVGDGGRQVKHVAIACGAGDSFVGAAVRAGADVLVTGEARYHAALEAEAASMAMALAGHHATERPGVERLAELLKGAYSGIEVWSSTREHDPLRV